MGSIVPALGFKTPCRSRGPRRRSTVRSRCNASVACTTPTGSGGRVPADRRARPREHRDHALPPPHSRVGRSASIVATIRSHGGQSPTPTTTTSDRPTSRAHMRAGSVSKQGLLAIRRLQTSLRFAEPPVPRPGIPTRPSPALRRGAPETALLRFSPVPMRPVRSPVSAGSDRGSGPSRRARP